jgi:hypothetical protein
MDTWTRNTDAEEMFGPPIPSDVSGLMPTLAAIVRRIDYERQVRWADQVKRSEARLLTMMRMLGGRP